MRLSVRYDAECACRYGVWPLTLCTPSASPSAGFIETVISLPTPEIATDTGAESAERVQGGPFCRWPAREDCRGRRSTQQLLKTHQSVRCLGKEWSRQLIQQRIFARSMQKTKQTKNESTWRSCSTGPVGKNRSITH